MLTLKQVRLSKYPEQELPAGFEFVSERKGKKDPIALPWNWFGRHNTAEHFIFHKLALANQMAIDLPGAEAQPALGCTIDELKAALPDADKPTVDKVLEQFKGHGPRHTGWDLVTDSATKTRFALIYRDPRKHYVQEQAIEGDKSGLAEAKAPTYVTRVPQLIDEEANPKPAATEKAPKAPRAPKSDAAVVAPTGGFLAAYALVLCKFDSQDTNVKAVLETAITQFVDEKAEYAEKEGEEKVNLREALLKMVDSVGVEGSKFVDFVARRQKDLLIRPGFYKIAKDMAKAYQSANAGTKVAPTAAPVPV